MSFMGETTVVLNPAAVEGAGSAADGPQWQQMRQMRDDVTDPVVQRVSVAMSRGDTASVLAAVRQQI